MDALQRLTSVGLWVLSFILSFSLTLIKQTDMSWLPRGETHMTKNWASANSHQGSEAHKEPSSANNHSMSLGADLSQAELSDDCSPSQHFDFSLMRN